MDSTAVLIRGLSKAYKLRNGGSFQALKHVDLDIPSGSCCALLGPNGAGKSTLINIIAGIVIKTSGKVNVAGYDLDLEPFQIKRHIGVVPQELSLDVFLPVYEALEIYAGYYGIRPQDRRTNEIMTILDLHDKKNSLSRSLSGGMKRRLLVAKALVHQPKVLILDEPTAGVDIDLRDKLWSYVRKLNELGTTIILTTHYMEEAENLCDYFIFINQGKVLLSRHKKDMHEFFSSRNVTLRFSRQMNVIPEFLAGHNALMHEGGYALTFTSSAELLGMLLAKTFESKELDIKDLEVKHLSLESVFREIISSNS